MHFILRKRPSCRFMHSLCKMRTFLCGESTVAAKQKKLLSTLPGSLLIQNKTRLFHVSTFLVFEGVLKYLSLSDCSMDVKSKFYTTLLGPQLEYTCSVWNPYTKQNIHQIEVVQHRPARFVFRDYSYIIVMYSHVKTAWLAKSLTTQTFVSIVNVL